MTNLQSPPGSRETDGAAVELLLAELEAEREVLRRQRWRNLLIGGAALSLLVHLSILWYLDSIMRGLPPSLAPTAVSIEFAIINEDELTQIEQDDFQEMTEEILADLSEMPDESPDIESELTPPAVTLDAVDSGSMESLSGAGGGTEGSLTLGGSGANTSFFGVSARGTRFAYVVDVSGSMSDNNKFRTAMSELARSIESLPDYAYYCIVLFSNGASIDRQQPGWVRARVSNIRVTKSWLAKRTPGGGTQPIPAFAVISGLEVRPDVIFFMTDGQIPAHSATDVRAMFTRASRMVINTIAFGDPRSQDLLKEIARQTGGKYRYVPSRGGGS